MYRLPIQNKDLLFLKVNRFIVTCMVFNVGPTKSEVLRTKTVSEKKRARAKKYEATGACSKWYLPSLIYKHKSSSVVLKLIEISSYCSSKRFCYLTHDQFESNSRYLSQKSRFRSFRNVQIFDGIVLLERFRVLVNYLSFYMFNMTNFHNLKTIRRSF